MLEKNKMDIAEGNFAKLFSEINEQLQEIESEEESKIKIINRILFEVLEWKTESLRAETQHDNGFSDYVVSEGKHACFIIEAKRIGKLPIKTAIENRVSELKISGSSLKKCVEGIEQAASYAPNCGTSLAVLTDGLSWIVFKTFVPGANYKDKQAIVFPSLESIKNDFSVFYELLSRTSSSQKTYTRIFDSLHNKRNNLVSKLYTPLYENEITRSSKSTLAFDLDKVFERYFAAMAGNDDSELIMECFVESKESQIADYSLEKITDNVLGNLDARGDVNNQLNELISDAVRDDSRTSAGETVFIVGPTGSGKTTFLDRFFKKTLSKSNKDRCLNISVNCLDSTGSETTIIDWMTEKLISIIQSKIFEEGFPSSKELKTLYFGDYRNMARTFDKTLYETDKIGFELKFENVVQEKVQSDRETYLKRLLNEVVLNRKMLPCFTVDNTDEKSVVYKERIFQFFQSLLREIKYALLLFPVTDKSAWIFSKTELYNIYRSKSFFLPTPSPRDVFRKRAEYLKKTLDDIKGNKLQGNYFLDRGIKISIQDLDGFVKALEDIFVEHDYASKTIGQLSNYNIRITLELSQRILTSSVFKIEDLIRSYIAGSPITTSYNKFVDALLKGNYRVYKKGDERELVPIFDVDPKVSHSPLLYLRVLSFLNRIADSGKNVEDRHVSAQSIIDYFESIGGTELAVETVLKNMLATKLIESYDISKVDLSPEQRFALSYKGKAHLRFGSRNSVYFYQMALTSTMLDEDASQKIRYAFSNTKIFSDKVIAVKEEFANYLLDEDSKFFSHKVDDEAYANQSDLLAEISKFANKQKSPENDLSQTMGETFREGIKFKDTLCSVDWYDPMKRYGYAVSNELDERIFFHLERLLEHQVTFISEGDKFLCDVSRGSKGFQIDKIHDLEVNSDGFEIVDCKIKRLYTDRNYGFAIIEHDEREAYFHTYFFEADQRKLLNIGTVFKAEVIQLNDTEAYQIRRVISLA